VVKKVNHLVTNLNQGWCHNLTRVVKKFNPQETDLQETDQETATGGRGGDPPGVDAAVLADELVSHGVGRATAERLARSKPEACRRCLEYLPYARVRTTKGAWLASGIRDDYGPPEGYEKARLERERREKARSADRVRTARLSQEDLLRRKKEERLAELYARLEEEGGEALSNFQWYLGEQRHRAERFAVHLSTQRREEHLAAFDGHERRLELFGKWLEGLDGKERTAARGVRPGASGQPDVSAQVP
jgi:hypothetical protein